MNPTFRKLLMLCLPCVLIACGGGGGGSSTTAVPVANPGPAQPTALFAATPVQFPDLQPVYASLCGTSTNISNPVVLDLNRDGKKDLVFTLSCVGGGTNTPTVGPSKSGLIVFLQNANGSYRLATREVFGISTDVYLLDGVTIGNVVADFNHDGYDDFVLSVSREDGRGVADSKATNLNTQNVFVMSSGSGSYTVSSRGQSAWNYGIVLVDNKDVVSLPIGYDRGVEAWNYLNGWNLLSGYEWLADHGIAPLFLSKSTGADTAVTASSMSVNFGLSLFKKNNSVWSQADTYKISDFKWVDFIGWSGSAGQARLISLDGVDYVQPSIEQICQVRLRKSDADAIALAIFSASQLDSAYKGGVLKEGQGMAAVSRMLGMSVANNRLTRSDSFQINNEVTAVSPYKLFCGDFNGDGYDDIAISDWRKGTAPLIYINDTTGKFNRISNANLPGLNLYAQGQAYFIADMDNDGFMDIVYYPVVGVNSGPVVLNMYKGLRHAQATDLVAH